MESGKHFKVDQNQSRNVLNIHTYDLRSIFIKNGLEIFLQFGIFESKKVKYKFDGYGIGHDQAEHHKFKWWERAFETAAASIEVGDGKPVTHHHVILYVL